MKQIPNRRTNSSSTGHLLSSESSWKDYSGNMPGVLTPIVCSLWVNREGLLFPNTTPFIPRDLLAPQGNDTFTIADVDKLDEF